MRYGEIEEVVYIGDALRAAGFAPRGPHRTKFTRWVLMPNRSGYNYAELGGELLKAMWSFADSEIERQVGQARRFAMELTGYNAIKRELEGRG